MISGFRACDGARRADIDGRDMENRYCSAGERAHAETGRTVADHQPTPGSGMAVPVLC